MAMAPLCEASKSETDLPWMEMEETVGAMEGVLVKTTEVALGDSDGATTAVDVGTYNKGEGTIGKKGPGYYRDDTDTIAVGVREGDEEEEIIDGDSLEGLSSIVLSRLRS